MQAGKKRPPLIPFRPDSSQDLTWWDQPKPNDVLKGDDTPAPIYQSVGKTLSTWEALEISLATLFTVLVESKSPAAFRAYGALASSTSRRDALANAGRTFLDNRKTAQSHLPSLEEILKHYEKAGGLRNNIAHGITVPARRYDLGISGFFLVSPFYNSRKFSLDRKRLTKALASKPPSSWRLSDLSYGVAIPGVNSGSNYRYTSEIIEHIRPKIFHLTYIVGMFIDSLPVKSDSTRS